MSTLTLDLGDKGVGIVSLVGKHGIWCEACNQGLGLGDVSVLAGGQNRPYGIPEGIYRRMDFGGQTAPRAAYCLCPAFFWAPAACWCARTIVLSIINSSMSGSRDTAAEIRCHTPASRHRAKRTYTLCHGPNSFGRSRQGAPVRPIQSTASVNRRLSLAVTPQSPGFPGRRSLIRSHWSSFRTNRSITGHPSHESA